MRSLNVERKYIFNLSRAPESYIADTAPEKDIEMKRSFSSCLTARQDSDETEKAEKTNHVKWSTSSDKCFMSIKRYKTGRTMESQ